MTGMAFSNYNCNSHWLYFFQKGIRYKHHQENFRESLANGITPFGLRIKKAPGIVPVTEDFYVKWNEILKGTERKLIDFVLVESENVIAKIELEVDSSINSDYPDNVEAEAKRLLDRNKHLEKILEQCRKKKWKKFTNRVDYGYFKPKDLSQLQKTGEIIEELNQEMVKVDIETLRKVGKKETICRNAIKSSYKNTVETNSKPKSTDKNEIMEPVVSKANNSLCGDNKIEGGKNIHFAIENKLPDRKKNEFTPKREQKVKVKVFVSQNINGSRESNCNINLNVNVLSGSDEDLVSIVANLGETEINISHINEIRNDMSSTKLGGSITTAEPSINRVTLIDKGRICGFYCFKTVFNLSHKILTETEVKVLKKRSDFAPVQRTLNENPK